MNREILFRAKRRDNGEWVEGYVIQRYGAWFIYDIKNADTCIQNGYLVDSDTICQYTGLTDKKGRKIFGSGRTGNGRVMEKYYITN